MIDTDKYEGHTPGPWTAEYGDYITHVTNSDKVVVASVGFELDKDGQLIADAPLLLERVIHLEHILKCAKDVLTNIYTYDKDLEDAEWIAWFCDMEDERE